MTKPGIVVIGTSAGSLQVLPVVLGALPKDFPLPVVVVQHRGKDSDETLIDVLQRGVELQITEPLDKQKLEAGCVYVAPANYHLLVENGHFALSTEAPVHYARPSIDVFFESVAEEFGGRAIGVLLTGANEDGAEGLRVIKKEGGYTIIQDPETAEARQMPDAALALFRPDAQKQPAEIGPLIVELSRRRAG